VKGDDIAERLLSFAVRIIKISNALPNSQLGKHICGQIVRAGTSAGANYEEARGAESNKDFIHKLGICLKELRESRYWLRVIEHAKLISSERLKDILPEAD
jgi:four helix bundle protein